MVTETSFSSGFDYSSAFKYDSILPPSKSMNCKYKSAFTYHSLNIDPDDDAGKLEIRIRSFGNVCLPLAKYMCVHYSNNLLGIFNPHLYNRFAIILNDYYR